MTTLKHILTERLTSRYWWQAIACAVLSFVFFRLRVLTASAYFLDAARRSYREFFISRKTRLLDKLAALDGVHRFMAVVASPDPHTGEEETQVIWTKAGSAAEATRNILSGGRLFRIVSMSGGDSGKTEEPAKRLWRHVLDDVAKPWLVSQVKKKVPLRVPLPVGGSTIHRLAKPDEEPPTQILPKRPSVLSTIIASATPLPPIKERPRLTASPFDEAAEETTVVLEERTEGNEQEEPVSLPPIPPKVQWVGHSRNCAISFRKSGKQEVHTEFVKIPVDKNEEPLQRAAKAIEMVRDLKPHLRNVSLVPVGLLTLDVGPQDKTAFAKFYLDTSGTAHVFKGEWTDPPKSSA